MSASPRGCPRLWRCPAETSAAPLRRVLSPQHSLISVVTSLSTIVFALLGSLVSLGPSPVVTPAAEVAAGVAAQPVDDGRGTPYIVNKSANICGLDQPRQLTKPAVVDYDALLAATPEAKKIAKDKIDPKSSQGITLMTKARARILKACESVRASGGHCSVWKDIKRRDGKAIADITDAVKRQL